MLDLQITKYFIGKENWFDHLLRIRGKRAMVELGLQQLVEASAQLSSWWVQESFS